MSFSFPARVSLIFSCSKKQAPLPTAEDHQAKFYKHYRRVSRVFDKEFLKKYDEDLDTTLIFVSRARMKLLRTRINQKDRLVYFPL